jgi:hypothetical protein
MRLSRVRALAPLLCALASPKLVDSFSVIPYALKSTRYTSPKHQLVSMASMKENCGCDDPVRYSGDPPEEIKLDFDIRQSLRSKNIYNIKGQSLTIDDILGEPDRPRKETSIVVFFRSLG